LKVCFTSLCTTRTVLETNVTNRIALGKDNKEHKYIKHLYWLLLQLNIIMLKYLS